MNTSTSKELSIIIVNYNTKSYLKNCLNSIFNKVKSINYEIIVVDNHSSDSSADFIRQNFSEVKLITNSNNVGFAKANNQAIKVARGDFILLLNPDTEILDKSIQKMVSYARNNTDVGIIGCRVINPGNSIQWDSCGKYMTPLTLLLKQLMLEKLLPANHFFGQRLMFYWPRNTSRNVDWVSGVCILVRKETISAIGLLDERFFAYMEDMDLCHRAIHKGWRVYFLSDAQILHNLSTSWRHRSDKHLQTSLMSECLYFGKYYGFRGRVTFKILYLIGSYLRLILNILAKNKEKARDHYVILNWLTRNQI